MICDEVVPPERMDQALAGVIDGLTSSGVVSAVVQPPRLPHRPGAARSVPALSRAVFPRAGLLPFQPSADRQPGATLECQPATKSDANSDLGFVHRFVPGADAARPPLLLLHGTGGDEHDLIPLAAADRARPHAAVAARQGERAGPDAVLPPLARRRLGPRRFQARAPPSSPNSSSARSRRYELAKPIALGYSNGANIAWSLLLKEPGLLAGAILLRAMLPFDPRPLPDLPACRCC